MAAVDVAAVGGTAEDGSAPDLAPADVAAVDVAAVEVPDEVGAGAGASAKFSVHLDNFEGPFDLLLQLISKHKLDVTEIALSQVTDEFIGYIKALGPAWDLDQTSEFLLVASTLLDLKAARLLPRGEVEDAEDLALLEARDLLFARLLQYRAFKRIAGLIQQRMAEEGRRFPRTVGLEPRYADLLPEVLIGVDPADFAALAAAALSRRPALPDSVSLAHLHAPAVTVREQAAVIVELLREARSTTFRALIADSPDTVTTVCRFLALLELFREAAVTFDQETPLGELTIRWTGTDAGEIAVGDEFDEVHPPEPTDGEAPQVSDDHVTAFLTAGESHTEDDAPDNVPDHPATSAEASADALDGVPGEDRTPAARPSDPDESMTS